MRLSSGIGLSICLIGLSCMVSINLGYGSDSHPAQFRPPAVPLVTHDPYFSVWSMNDRLTEDWTKHWTGKNNAMCSLIRIDGNPYRIMGPQPDKIPAMEQISLEVFPTRSIYHFEASGVRLQLTFLSPLLPHDLAVLSRPVSYLTWEVQSVDNRSHAVSLYFDVTGEWVVNTPNQKITGSRMKLDGMDLLRFGSLEQPILEKRGDDLRIDWGYLYLVIPPNQKNRNAIAADTASRSQFVQEGTIADSDDFDFPRAVSDRWPVLACVLDCGSVGADLVSQSLLLAYDDIYSIEYFQRKLRPYWRQMGLEFPDLIRRAVKDYPELREQCRRLDEDLTADLRRAGGDVYTRLCTLAYRQCFAAHKLAADFDGTPLLFPKENFSNGCIATVDVIYPSSPFFLLLNIELAKAQITPVLEYSLSKRWKFPFAPHDLGTYPQANGQVYGGGEKTEENQMPVEESGNMLLMLAAIAQVEGNADYAKKYWEPISQWAEYLKEKGMDPENQLCTDDFAGHLAHNTNLSIKAIVALGGYAQLCKRLGFQSDSEKYRALAEKMAAEWVKKADDGDHYRLAFDKPGTWSQKYNLVWDRILGLHLFPESVAQKELAIYKTKLNPFGLPLDNRKTYTKTDWSVWTASLANNQEDFMTLIAPLDRFMQSTPDRVPLTDWYETTNGKKTGFQARSVIGGVYIQMLMNSDLWKKWVKP